LALLVAGAGAGAYWRWFRGAAIESLAVIPFVNSTGNPDLEYVSEGFTDSVVNTLGRLPALQVHGRMAIPQFRKNRPDAQTIGRILNVGAVLGGAMTENNGVLTVNAELVDARDGRHLWGQRYERRRAEISSIQEDVCQEVARTLRLKLTPDDKRALRKRFTANPQAEQLYLQGRFFWNQRAAGGIKTAISYFNRAIDADPNYALPYAGLADALMTQSGSVPPKQVMPQAELAALQAINKDDELAQAHAALASIKLHYDWDWLDAEKEYKRAIELDPSFASAHSWYAVYLWVMERFDEALAEANRALTLEPTSLPIRLGVARSLTMARRYDAALAQYQETLKMFPNAKGVPVEIGMVYERKGMYKRALAEYSRLWTDSNLPDDSGPIATMGHLYAKLGRRADALNALDRLKKMAQSRYVSPCEIATIEAGLADKQGAVDSLTQCYDDRSWEIIFLKLDPAFDDLHGQPGYEALVKKLKL
jgi:TolB-like protein/Tfp pilus assembly protein PilF